MITSFKYIPSSRNFSISEPLNDGKTVSQKSSYKNIINKSNGQKWTAIFKDLGSGNIKSKRLTSKSRMEAMNKIRESFRKDRSIRPVSLRLFRLPDEHRDADNYKSKLRGKNGTSRSNVRLQRIQK